MNDIGRLSGDALEGEGVRALGLPGGSDRPGPPSEAVEYDDTGLGRE